MGRPKKEDGLTLEEHLKERRKFLEEKYKEDLELVEKCFCEDSQVKQFLWFKGYEFALDTFNKELEKALSLKN